MPSTCPACHRLNPEQARYCFRDGVALPGSQSDAPIAVGSRPFLAPFVFPSGRSCRNFDELVRGCEIEWNEARDMLGQGFFEGFLGGLGRADLALAARQAAKEPDRDLALDGFLARMPGERTAPQLHADPKEINLGQIDPAQPRSFVIQVSNQGGGLLSGTAQSEAAWLALGDAPGAPNKLFHCRSDFALPVQIHPAALRAGKPQEGKIVLDAGNDSLVILVRAGRPVIPFAEGKLAGASTPRQLAEKARDHPREAAPLFESGSVARWYERNGWTYPVQGPAATGTAAVQQYFEALGLTRPPKVVMPQTKADLVGVPGGSAEAYLFLETAENRPVYARAASDTDWLEIGKIRHQGASARVQLLVPRVPARPGQKLIGRGLVIANGNQRFEIEVHLQIQGVAASSQQPPPVRRAPVEVESAPVYSVKEVPAVPVLVAKEISVEAVPVPPLPPAPPTVIRRPAQDTIPPIPGRRVEPPPPVLEPVAYPRQPRSPLVHLIAPGIILLALLGALVHDLLLPRGGAAGDGPELIDPKPLIALEFHDGAREDKLKVPPRLMTFGVNVLDESGKSRAKQLMYDPAGRTNNVCIRVDRMEFLLGHPDLVALAPGADPMKVDGVGSWVEMKTPLGKVARTGRVRDGARSVWRITGPARSRVNIEVVQTVEVVPGEQSGRLDTALIRYTLINKGDQPHDVGLRFLLDTFIGNNDGVPFTIPGQAGLCSTKHTFARSSDVPDYIQALENESLLRPGTVAHLQFRIPGALEPPTSVILGGWPDLRLSEIGFRQALSWYTLWDVPALDIRELFNRRNQFERRPEPDSAVTLYWDPRPLAPKAKREVGFSYGLGEVASAESEGKLLLTVGGRTVRDGEFSLTALRANPVAGERLTLRLPPGEIVQLLSTAEQPVPPVEAGATRPISTVTWRLKGLKTGQVPLQVESSVGFRQTQMIRISPPRTGILD